MNGSKLISSARRTVLALLLFGVLPAIVGVAGPIITDGCWEDTFDDATGLEDLNQTLVDNGAVRLNGGVRQAWEISSQVSFQAGELDRVDAEATSGALQLAPAALSFSPNRLVGNVASYHYYEPSALAGDGGQMIHLAWAHTEENDIFYRCSTDAGQNWTAIGLLSDGGAPARQRSPDLIVASTGKVYAAWRDERLDENGDIYLASRQGCGGTWSPHTPVPVAAIGGVEQGAPALSVDGMDNLYLTWEEDGDVYFSRSGDAGQSWSAGRKLNDDSGALGSLPDILVDQAGQKVLVAWAYGPDGAESNIYFAISGDGGQTWSVNLPVAPDPTKSQYHPAVAQAPDGTLYVGWAGGGVYISRSLDGGQMWGPAVPVHDEPYGLHWSGTSLTVDDRGTLYLAWHDKRHRVNPIYQPSSYYDVFVSCSQDGGQSWSANMQLNDDAPLSGAGTDRIDHMYPSVMINQAGQFFAAWWDERGMCEVVDGGILCVSPHTEVYFVRTPGYAFAQSGKFTSAVHDASGQATWDTIAWTAAVPPSTTMTIHTRSGDTPVPDVGWSDWSLAYQAPGQAAASPEARYIQVRAALTTTNPLTTPILYDVTLHYRPFIWEQTTYTDFAGSVALQNVDVTTLPGSVQLLPDVAFSPERRVNDHIGCVEQVDDQPALAVAGSQVYLAWGDTRDDSEGDIFFARSTDGGQSWGANVRINDDGAGAEQSAPYLATRGDHVYLAWHDEREDGQGDIYFARSTDGGQSWSANRRVNDGLPPVAGDPTIVTGAGSRLHVTWATSKTLVYSNRSTDAGQSWQGNVAVGGAELSWGSFSGYPAPGMAADGSGNVYAAWWDTRYAFHDEGCMCLRDIDIFAARSTDNAGSWGAGVQITGDDGVATQSRPHLAYRDGDLYVVWTDFRDSAISDDRDPAIYFARSTDGGQTWSPTNVQVNTHEVPYVALDPVVAVDDDGVLYVIWRGDYLDSARDVFFTRSLDSGDAWQVERRVNTDAIGAEQGAPALVATTPGRVYLAWHDERAGTQDLYFATSLTGKTYTNGTLVSSVLDSEGAAQWGDIAWTATTPPGTSLTLYTRSGNTTNPDDGTWSGWSAGTTTSPTLIGSPPARYLQYRVDLATTDPYTTPVLHDVSVEYGRYPLQGSAVSVPISPPAGFVRWQTATFSGSIPSGTTLTVDVLDSEGNLLLEDVESGVSLTGYSPALYPSLRLQVDLTTSDPTITPVLNDWALTWRRPPAEHHVRVVDADGEPAGDTDIYHNGSYLGTTDHLGLLDLPGPPQVGDTLGALHPLAETPTCRDAHGGWAYRTYITNIGVDAVGATQVFTVSQTSGEQLLVVRPENTLVLFNLLVSVEWDATDAYLQDVTLAVEEAADFLYDVTDGQMSFGQVVIYDGAEHWPDADVQISTKNVVHPHAYIGGLTDDETSHLIRVGRSWDGNTANQGQWSQPNGYKTLVHEFGHYGLGLYDEYFGYRVVEGQLAGRRQAWCTGSENRISDTIATNASIMDYHYTTTELADAGRWTVWCQETAQHQLNNGEADWQTLLRLFQDPTEQERWHLVSPDDRAGWGIPVPGPHVLPSALPFPVTTIHNEGDDPEPFSLYVCSDSVLYREGAWVTLSRASGKAMDQGLTDGADGQLTILGARENDSLQVVSLDGTLSASARVGDVLSRGYLDLTPPVLDGAGLTRVTAGSEPYLRLWPTTSGGLLDGLLLVVTRTLPSDTLRYVLTGPDDIGPSAAVPRDEVEGDHRVQVGFIPTARAGYAGVMGRHDGQYVELNVDFRLQHTANVSETNLYSNDGNLKLHLDAGSLPWSEVHFLIASPWGLPGPPPMGMAIVGEAYEITASDNVIGLLKPAILRLHYDAEASAAFAAESLTIYGWDFSASTWRPLSSEINTESQEVVTAITDLGMYALMGNPVATLPLSPNQGVSDDICRLPGSHRAYLPLVTK